MVISLMQQNDDQRLLAKCVLTCQQQNGNSARSAGSSPLIYNVGIFMTMCNIVHVMPWLLKRHIVPEYVMKYYIATV